MALFIDDTLAVWQMFSIVWLSQSPLIVNFVDVDKSWKYKLYVKGLALR